MAEYSKLGDDKLLRLLATEGDRLSRQVIDEMCRREGMVERLGAIVADPYNWNEPLPAWWAPVHAVYALGSIGTAETVVPLCRALRYAEACENDWVTEDLPSIFGRIGSPASDLLETMAFDPTSGWLVRAIALEGLAAITLGAPGREQSVFQMIHGLFSKEGEDRQLRQNAGNILLDFLRPESREALAAFGREERLREDKDPSYKAAFTDLDVEAEFGRGVRATERYLRDWLLFYEPSAIAERQQRWDRERIEKASSPEHRTAHEFCPLASDKSHRRCCLGKVGIA